MIRIIPNSENFLTETDWLKSFHHFSFGEHYDPNKVSFGPLRVFNDDTVQPEKGFGFHSHRDMEIVSYVTEGSLEHKDNFGNKGIVEAGEVQLMSAGTGVFHSEFNHSKTLPLKFLQIWILPDTKGLKPSYGQKKITKQDRLNKLLRVISTDSSFKIHQDISFYISRLEKGELKHQFASGRLGYLFVIDGKVNLNGSELGPKDSAMIEKEQSMTLNSKTFSEIIFLDLAEKFLTK